MKKVKLNIEDFFNLPTAVLYNPDMLKPVRHVSIDSRNIKKNSLYIAIKGKRFDGHDFVKNAIKNGADVVLISSRKHKEFYDIKVPIITVQNTTKALGDIAGIWRKKLRAKIIGITGSSGKTSTREILATLLAQKYKVNQTELNNNNHIGVPLTILGTNENHDVLIAELGTNHFREIAYSAGILNPDYALITNIGDAHLKFLKSRAGVWKEKSALFKTTLKRNGKVFINFDDPYIKKFYRDKENFVSYGFTGRPKIKGRITRYTDDGLPIVEIKSERKKNLNKFSLHGEQNAKNYLAAAAVGLELGLTKSEFKPGISNMLPPPQRLNVRHYKNFTLIDDTYNANPDSAKAAIELVNKIRTFKRKVLILGDMLELGTNQNRLHKNLAPVVMKNKIDNVYTIGSLMKNLSNAISRTKVNNEHFRTRNLLSDFIKQFDFSDAVVLVKGSRGMKMEDFLKIIERKAIS